MRSQLLLRIPASPMARVATLAALACGFLPTLHAGSISAYRDTAGRVIFVNERPNPGNREQGTGNRQEPDSRIPNSDSRMAPDSPIPNPESRTLPDPQVLNPQSRIPIADSRTQPVIRPAWDDMIEGAALRHKVDPALVRAIVQVESNFNPFAISSRGARGLMQLVPATAKRFGVRDVFDPKSNLDGGVRYLKYLMKLFGGDLQLSLAAYNAGENAVDRHNGVPPFPETQDYLRKIFEIYPLSSSVGVIAATRIGKYVDNNGIVHFSNTDLP